ncbi:MAG: Vps62-related protein, partial [Nannocystaceae bacterium]
DAYFNAAKAADDLLGQLRTALEANGMWPYTALLVSSDHGGAGFSHGADTTPERPIPFVARTPQGVPTAITRETRIWDIAATAAALLDLTPPPEWVASPVIEVWGPAETTEEAPLPQVMVDTLEPIYTDEGTGSFASVSFWRPTVPEGFRSLGDVPADTYTSPLVTGYAVAADHPAVVSPVGYEKIWSDEGANGNMMVTLWNPIPPAGYVCPGQLAKADYGDPPGLDEIACVRHEYLKLSGVDFVWDDTGSGASWDGSVWGCASVGDDTLVHPTFLSRRHHDGPGYGECMGLIESMTESAGG